MMSNVPAGSGQESHEVPSELGRVVLIRDGQRVGMEVYRVEGGFRFVSLDLGGGVKTAPRCALVALEVSADDLLAPFGCDLESPRGLALVGLNLDEDPSKYGEVLWDSAVEVLP